MGNMQVTWQEITRHTALIESEDWERAQKEGLMDELFELYDEGPDYSHPIERRFLHADEDVDDDE